MKKMLMMEKNNHFGEMNQRLPPHALPLQSPALALAKNPMQSWTSANAANRPRQPAGSSVRGASCNARGTRRAPSPTIRQQRADVERSWAVKIPRPLVRAEM
jgi:hypothetical protein